MSVLLPEIRSRIISIVFVLCWLNLCFGCASSKQITVEQASWLASDNTNLIVHCKGAKYDIHKVKFGSNFLLGEIDEEKQATIKSIHFYASQITQSDSLTNIIVYYDDIEEVTEGKKNSLRIGKTSWIVIGAVVLLAGVPIYF